MRYWKVLNGRESTNGGSHRWRLRVWTPEPVDEYGHSGPLDPCVRGFHLCRDEQVLWWLGPTICEAEIHPDAEVVKCGDKIVVSRCRIIRECTGWTEQTAREFACDCVAHALRGEHRAGRKPVLPHRRSYAAVARAATRDAAWAAAWDAARDAISGERGVSSQGGAVWDPAWDAERAWQYKRLLQLLEEES